MVKPVIEFEHVSKDFKADVSPPLGSRIVGRLKGNRYKPERVHALDDVSFTVEPGASVALMGLNGSGKTTALSIVARISYPTVGKVTVRGHVGALLAVGTGLHQELTGRENIDLYARILGYTKADIARKFDDIVDFSEIGFALDRPLKFYSSGMSLRLGFSIAAHVEPAVLLVDEAVSVGDALFQQRCLDRMSQLVKEGSALVLVSHLPDIVARSCTHGMLLRSGKLVATGPVDQIIGAYLDETGKKGGDAEAADLDVEGWNIDDFDVERRTARVTVDLIAHRPLFNLRFGVNLADLQRGPLVSASMHLDAHDIGEVEGRFRMECELTDIPLRPGVYRVIVYAASEGGGQIALAPHVLGHIKWGDATEAPVAIGRTGFGAVEVPHTWHVERIP